MYLSPRPCAHITVAVCLLKAGTTNGVDVAIVTYVATPFNVDQYLDRDGSHREAEKYTLGYELTILVQRRRASRSTFVPCQDMDCGVQI